MQEIAVEFLFILSKRNDDLMVMQNVKFEFQQN